MTRHSLVLASALLALCPALARGQEVPLPTPEEYAERARKAEAAALFAEQTPLEVILRTDISWIRDERSEEEEAEGTLSYKGPDGAEVSLPVKVRARGIFRRDKRNCNFPPLRLNFAGKQVAGTLFEGQDKLKLVTPCQDSRDNYQQYLLQEYLVYRVYQLLTPMSFRVRLVTITYEDPDGGYDPRTKTAFLIEDGEQMAARNRATMTEVTQFHPGAMEREQSALVGLFQFMIGNTDFSTAYFHNSTMIRDQDGRFLVVPYDFDWSGVVDARYAVPDPRLEIRDVTQRIFRGFCEEGVDQEALKSRFNEQREAIGALYEGMDGLDEDGRTRAIEYYGKFFEIINDPRRYEREVLRACQEIPS